MAHPKILARRLEIVSEAHLSRLQNLEGKIPREELARTLNSFADVMETIKGMFDSIQDLINEPPKGGSPSAD